MSSNSRVLNSAESKGFSGQANFCVGSQPQQVYSPFFTYNFTFPSLNPHASPHPTTTFTRKNVLFALNQNNILISSPLPLSFSPTHPLVMLYILEVSLGAGHRRDRPAFQCLCLEYGEFATNLPCVTGPCSVCLNVCSISTGDTTLKGWRSCEKKKTYISHMMSDGSVVVSFLFWLRRSCSWTQTSFMRRTVPIIPLSNIIKNFVLIRNNKLFP